MIETCSIYPTNKYNRPLPPLKVYLHGLDLCPPIQIRNHRFFHGPQSSSTNIVDKLKSSLAEALELYPPVAGTVLVDVNGDTYISMDEESSLGTPFIFERKDSTYAGDTEDLSPRKENLLPPSSSTLAVKVTMFSCGTLAVASSIRHQVTDLRGFLDFLELWAQITRGEPIDFSTIPDDWSRTPGRFFANVKKESSSTPPPGFVVLPTPVSEPPPFLLAPAKVSKWKFIKSSVEQLKKDFYPSKAQNSDVWISSGDAVAALLCGAVTRARENAKVGRLEGRSSLESQIETFMMAADGRDRSPGGSMIGGKYFGNFNPLFRTVVSRSELLSLSLESASRVSVEIRKALNAQLSPEAIAHKISFMEDPQNAKPPGRIVWTADIIMTNWCRFDLKGPKLDFGWGKPFHATSGDGIHPPGYIMLTQEKSSGDIYAVVAVELSGADGLLADTLLNKYATLVKN